LQNLPVHALQEVLVRLPRRPYEAARDLAAMRGTCRALRGWVRQDPHLARHRTQEALVAVIRSLPDIQPLPGGERILAEGSMNWGRMLLLDFVSPSQRTAALQLMMQHYPQHPYVEPWRSYLPLDPIAFAVTRMDRTQRAGLVDRVVSPDAPATGSAIASFRHSLALLDEPLRGALVAKAIGLPDPRNRVLRPEQRRELARAALALTDGFCLELALAGLAEQFQHLAPLEQEDVYEALLQLADNDCHIHIWNGLGAALPGLSPRQRAHLLDFALAIHPGWHRLRALDGLARNLGHLSASQRERLLAGVLGMPYSREQLDVIGRLAAGSQHLLPHQHDQLLETVARLPEYKRQVIAHLADGLRFLDAPRQARLVAMMPADAAPMTLANVHERGADLGALCAQLVDLHDPDLRDALAARAIGMLANVLDARRTDAPAPETAFRTMTDRSSPRTIDALSTGLGQGMASLSPARRNQLLDVVSSLRSEPSRRAVMQGLAWVTTGLAHGWPHLTETQQSGLVQATAELVRQGRDDVHLENAAIRALVHLATEAGHARP
jgi:hypothetical protein